eukprot:10369784-Ditylum_brightwellii.AAC.1
MVVMAEIGKDHVVTESTETEPPAVETIATEGAIYNTEAEVMQLQEEIAELEARCKALRLSTRPSRPELGTLFNDFVDLDAKIAGHTIAMPIFGGIFKDKNQDKELIIPWSGTDPDSTINGFSWFKDDSKWKIPRNQHFPRAKLIKGPYYIDTKCNGLTKNKKVHPLMTIQQYKDA